MTKQRWGASCFFFEIRRVEDSPFSDRDFPFCKRMLAFNYRPSINCIRSAGKCTQFSTNKYINYTVKRPRKRSNGLPVNIGTELRSHESRKSELFSGNFSQTGFSCFFFLVKKGTEIGKGIHWLQEKWGLLSIRGSTAADEVSPPCANPYTMSLMLWVWSMSWLQITIWRSFLLYRFFIACRTPWSIGWIREIVFGERKRQVTEPSRLLSSSEWAEQLSINSRAFGERMFCERWFEFMIDRSCVFITHAAGTNQAWKSLGNKTIEPIRYQLNASELTRDQASAFFSRWEKEWTPDRRLHQNISVSSHLRILKSAQYNTLFRQSFEFSRSKLINIHEKLGPEKQGPYNRIVRIIE